MLNFCKQTKCWGFKSDHPGEKVFIAFIIFLKIRKDSLLVIFISIFLMFKEVYQNDYNGKTTLLYWLP